jgi:hypothetical protein
VDRVAVEGAVGGSKAARGGEGEGGVALGRAEEGGTIEPTGAAAALELQAARQDGIGTDEVGQRLDDEVEGGGGEDDGSALFVLRSKTSRPILTSNSLSMPFITGNSPSKKDTPPEPSL